MVVEVLELEGREVTRSLVEHGRSGGEGRVCCLEEDGCGRMGC